MHVKVLECAVYTPDGRISPTEKVVRPTLEQIEQAIRRLDRYRFPFMFLWPTEDEQAHVGDGSRECLQIMGGEGVYWLAVCVEGGFCQHRLIHADAGDEEIEVWTSDQGFADAARHICRDAEIVVRAAKYYAQSGKFDPTLSWENDPA